MELQKTAIAMAIATLSLTAHADIISNPTISNHTVTISGNAAISGSPYCRAGLPPNFGPVSTSSGTVQGSVYCNFTLGSEAKADTTGSFQMSAGGIGLFSADALVNNHFTFTNNSSVATSYTLNLRLNAGYAYVGHNQEAETGFKIKITEDGNSIYDHAAFFYSDGSLSQDFGSAFGLTPFSKNMMPGYPDRTGYQWEDTWLEVDLGLLAANQSVDIDYDFMAYAFSDGMDPQCSVLYAGYGCGTGVNVGDPYSVGNGSSAIAISTNDDPVTPPSSVPEPASIWLGLTGLMGIAALRRKRRWQI